MIDMKQAQFFLYKLYPEYHSFLHFVLNVEYRTLYTINRHAVQTFNGPAILHPALSYSNIFTFLRTYMLHLINIRKMKSSTAF